MKLRCAQQFNNWTALKSLVYLASVLEVKTVDRRFDCQLIAPLPMLKRYPAVERLVWRQPAQSASVKPRSIWSWPLYVRLRDLVPLRYRRIRRASFTCCGPGFVKCLLATETAYAISPLVPSMTYINDPITRWYSFFTFDGHMYLGSFPGRGEVSIGVLIGAQSSISKCWSTLRT